MWTSITVLFDAKATSGRLCILSSLFYLPLARITWHFFTSKNFLSMF